MTSQNPEKSNVVRWDFLRMPGGGLVAASAKAVRKRQDRIECVGVRHEGAAAFMARGFAQHIGQLGVSGGTACIRHKSSARRPNFTVHGLC
jgi:threonine dehydratase